MADPELTKAFTEHQAKVIETNTNVQRLQQQIDDLKISIKRSQLTGKEISQLPDGTPMYESIGRLFILTAMDEVKKHIKSSEEEAEQKIKLLQKEKDTHEANLKRSEDSIRELVSQKRK